MKKSKFELYNIKVIVSGDVVEIYRYEDERYKKLSSDEIEDTQEAVVESDSKTKTQSQAVKSNGDYKRRAEHIARTKRNLKRLIESNTNQYSEKDKFITLDFSKYLSRDDVVYRFKQFNKRLRRKYPNYDYQYIAIIERGGNGTQRLHLHCLFFGLPFINIYTFQKLWKYGNVDMEAVKDGNVANYVLKYIEKTLEDGSYIPKGANFYLASRGLKKPVESYMTYEQFSEFITENPDKVIVYANEYDSEFVGRFEYYKMYSAEQAEKRMTKEKYELYQEYGDFINEEARQKQEIYETLLNEYNMSPEEISL
ncbi:hypothetical protein MKC79_09800 [[Clostridium] innocuum]|nr:hypothetical protein [[Clostridium] innocuum]